MLRYLLLALSLVAASAAAQEPSPSTAWVEIGQMDAARVFVDSITLRRTGGESFGVDTRLLFADTLTATSGERFDREVDFQELDCGARRSRAYGFVLLLGDSVVKRVPLAPEWERVADEQMPLFRARCEYLRSSAAMRRPVTVEVSSVEERPALINAGRVFDHIRNIYPEVRALGFTTATLVVAFDIDERGVPDLRTLQVISSELPTGESFARRVVEHMRFRPARINRRALRTRLQLPITFQPR